jgi:hypothetical protein
MRRTVVEVFVEPRGRFLPGKAGTRRFPRPGAILSESRKGSRGDVSPEGTGGSCTGRFGRCIGG